ncbi:MAG: beta-ketoacyl synthase chain length factor [Deltaproteobacteria bacterium]|nr:beta-ketoacyl synthase chain length factor [Deltaproteobacteria bacterium]
MSSVFKISDWSARSKGLDSKLLFEKWLKEGTRVLDDDGVKYVPGCKELKPAVRRRATLLSKLVIDSFYEITIKDGGDLSNEAMVFASKNGEIEILDNLLNQMYQGEELSPMDFCNSVHHTPTGYLSMATLNRGISKTVSAGNNTFAAGLLEAAVIIERKKSDSVYLLVSDLMVPESLGEVLTPDPFAYGMAILLEEADGMDKNSFSIDDIKELFYTDSDVFDFLKRHI